MDTDPLLALRAQPEPLPGVADFRGRPVHRRTSGGWRAALFVVAVEVAGSFAFFGISSNLISYLTGRLGQSNAAAAAAVNAWTGTAALLPLLGAFFADSFLGRYRSIILACFLYFLGYGMLTLSSVLLALHPSSACRGISGDSTTCRPSGAQIAAFYFSLYLIALAQGFDKPCGLAFGADQFDPGHPEESASRSSFFNWWYFYMAVGISIAVVVLSYIQDNIGWGLGFGLPCLIMLSASTVFLLGSPRYRVYVRSGAESPFIRLGRTFVAFARSRRKNHRPSEEAVVKSSSSEDERGGVDISQVEEARGVLRLLPIWAACLAYGVVFAQIMTLFNKQGRTLDRRIGPSFQLPPAALQSFGTVTILVFVPVYDRVLVPAARRLTGNPSGLTMLQRVGTGMSISLATVAAAALVEKRRLDTARESGLVDRPDATIPMSWLWMVPQYILVGVADVFTIVGLQEFFYDQMPDALRSLGLALYLSIIGLGGFISSFLISAIDEVTSKSGDSWFADNLNRAHLDYFYWLLAGLSSLELALFLCFARSYVYRHKGHPNGFTWQCPL